MDNEDELDKILREIKMGKSSNSEDVSEEPANEVEETKVVEEVPEETADEAQIEDDKEVVEENTNGFSLNVEDESTNNEIVEEPKEETEEEPEEEIEEPEEDDYKPISKKAVDSVNDPVEEPEEVEEEIPIEETAEENEEVVEEEVMDKKSGGKKKTVIIAIVAIVVIIAVVVGLYFGGAFGKEEETTTQVSTTVVETTTEPAPVLNPYTGEEGYNEDAVGKRSVAIVVENQKSARPQWGIGSSDIIVEGDAEGGISRMLWIYADYTSVPSEVGPIRSARPPYVQFSELFDSVFIHWGGSHSKGDYTGGYDVISNDKVDDIDEMTDNLSGVSLFSRDKSRKVDSEHTGVLDGSKIEAAIEKMGYRTEANEDKYTTFSFNEEVTNAGTTAANSVGVKFTKASVQTRTFAYNTSDKKYHTDDWKTDVSFENIIVIQTKSHSYNVPYKGATTTYVNYDIKNASGTGKYISNGTATDINWSTKDGVLKLTDANGNEIKLNTGKSYIGLASSNNGGTITIK